MKHSPKLQEKFDQLAEKKRLELQQEILDGLKTDFKVEAKFVQVGDAGYENPSKYLASYDCLEAKLAKENCETTDTIGILNLFIGNLREESICGEVLLYVSSDSFGGCWLTFEPSHVGKVIDAIVNKVGLKQEFEMLLTSTKSNYMLALFEDECDYVVGRCVRQLMN